MSLWLLEARKELPCALDPWHFKCGVVEGMVVRAPSEVEARNIAHENSGYETAYANKLEVPVWLNDQYTSCTELLVDGPSEVLMRDLRE